MVEYMKKNSPKILLTIIITMVLFSSSTLIIVHAQDQGPGSPNPPEDVPAGSDDAPGNDDPIINPPQTNNPNENDDTNPTDTEQPQGEPQQEKEGEDNNQGSDADDKGQNQHQEQNQNGEQVKNEEISEKQQRYEQRNLTVTRSMNQTRIRSTWQQDTEQDSFELLIDTEGKPKINFEYTTNNSSENKLTYQIVFKDIKEFEDTNGNGYCDEDDTIIGVYTLEQASFRSMNYENMTSPDGENIQIISTGTIDNMFTARFYAAQRHAYIAQSLCTPNEIKMDFIINNYQFKQNNTHLSLNMELRTNLETNLDTETFDESIGYATNENQFTIRSGNHTGFFSWVDTIDVDNSTQQVQSMISSEKKQTIQNSSTDVSTISTISFSYPQGQNIVHDPKIGIISLSTESYAASEIAESIAMLKMTSIYSYLIVCILAAILFLGIVYYRKRV